MARKRTELASHHVEPDEELQEGPGEDEETDAETGKSITKSEAARRAIDAGMGSPEEATDFIRRKFGIEMSRQHFSSVKSQMKKKEGAGAVGGRPGRKPKAAVEGYLAPPPRTVPAGEGDLIDVLEQMKPIIAMYGAEKVKRLVDLLG